MEVKRKNMIDSDCEIQDADVDGDDAYGNRDNEVS